MEEVEEFSDYWQYIDEEEQYTFAVYRIYKLCIEPSLSEVIPYIGKVLFFCFLFRILTQIKWLTIPTSHALTAICGMLLFYYTTSSSFLILGYIAFMFMLMRFTYLVCQHYFAYSMAVLCLVYLFVCEFLFPASQIWYETRGQHMVATMKLISVAFDVQSRTVHTFPTILEYAGYMLCPCNCLLGPWISFSTYRAIFTVYTPFFDIKWLKDIVVCILKAIVFLTVSNCWSYYLIPDTWRWFVAYKEALAFRSSHYFISFLSEAAIHTGGFGYLRNLPRRRRTTMVFEVTRPIEIELPRSLAQVVIYWNIPIHIWLKNYVFLVCQPLGSFWAVIMTYLISSLLHGFNIRLAAVLLSLGFYTYVEYMLRNKLAAIFNACIGSRECKNHCSHAYKDHIYVHLTNIMFSALTIFHLAYLGCLLDNSAETPEYEGYWSVFDKWTDLNYASHLCLLFEFYIFKVM